ncbi:MAG: SRPBCC family protein [Solirubrobacterales bacterium]|nr:SRPBCC family protein [Solirubrobacterales bacterium]
MDLDVQDVIRTAAGAVQASGTGASRVRDAVKSNGRGLSGMKGVAAGAGAAALAPIAIKGAAKLVKGLGPDGLLDAVKSPGHALGGLTSDLGDRVSSSVNEKIKDQVQQAGGPGGMMKEAVKSMLPFGGGDDSDADKDSVPGVGKGRRMPVQQSVDIGLPIETVYNQWTQFGEWPNFMHRVTRVTQEDDCTVCFATKIWGMSREFTANIETQRPNERIKWRVSEGMIHTGVVSFHELGPNLTRVLLSFDVQPGGMIEKAARGMRHVKRAALGDLHRFGAFIEMAERETGAWRGVIEDGKVVEKHDSGYDKTREYSDIDELVGDHDSDGGGDGASSGQKSRSSSGSASSRASSSSKSSGSRSSGSRSSGSGSSGSGQTRGRSGSSRRTSRGNSASGRSRSRASSNGSSASRGRGR